MDYYLDCLRETEEALEHLPLGDEVRAFLLVCAGEIQRGAGDGGSVKNESVNKPGYILPAFVQGQKPLTLQCG